MKTIKINFESLESQKEHQEILAQLLAQDPQRILWRSQTPYLLQLAKTHGPSEDYEIILDRELIQRQRKPKKDNPQETHPQVKILAKAPAEEDEREKIRYEVKDPIRLGKRGDSFVHRSAMTLRLIKLTLESTDEAQGSNDKTLKFQLGIKNYADKPRIIKIQRLIGGIDQDFRAVSREEVLLEHLLTEEAGNRIKPASFTKNFAYSIMEEIPGAPLSFILKERKHTRLKLSLERCLQISLSLLKAVKKILDLKILHRDLKPANLIIKCFEDSSHVRPIDFGLSCRLSDRQEGYPGTPDFMAPEVLTQRAKPSPASDIYSTAMILIKLWFKPLEKKPQTLGELIDLRTRSLPNLDSFYDNLDKKLSPRVKQSLRSLMQGFLALEPLERPSIEEAIDAFIQIEKRLNQSKSAGPKPYLNSLSEEKRQALNEKQSFYETLKKDDAFLQEMLEEYRFTHEELSTAIAQAQSPKSLSLILEQEDLSSSLIFEILNHEQASLWLKSQALEHEAYSPKVLESFIPLISSQTEPLLKLLLAKSFKKMSSISLSVSAGQANASAEYLDWETSLEKLIEEIDAHPYEPLYPFIKIIEYQSLSLKLAMKMFRLFRQKIFIEIPTNEQFKQAFLHAKPKERLNFIEDPLFHKLPVEFLFFLTETPLSEEEITTLCKTPLPKQNFFYSNLLRHQTLSKAWLEDILSHPTEYSNNYQALLNNPTLTPEFTDILYTAHVANHNFFDMPAFVSKLLERWERLKSERPSWEAVLKIVFAKTPVYELRYILDKILEPFFAPRPSFFPHLNKTQDEEELSLGACLKLLQLIDERLHSDSEEKSETIDEITSAKIDKLKGLIIFKSNMIEIEEEDLDPNTLERLIAREVLDSRLLRIFVQHKNLKESNLFKLSQEPRLPQEILRELFRHENMTPKVRKTLIKHPKFRPKWHEFEIFTAEELFLFAENNPSDDHVCLALTQPQLSKATCFIWLREKMQELKQDPENQEEKFLAALAKFKLKALLNLSLAREDDNYLALGSTCFDLHLLFKASWEEYSQGKTTLEAAKTRCKEHLALFESELRNAEEDELTLKEGSGWSFSFFSQNGSLPKSDIFNTTSLSLAKEIMASLEEEGLEPQEGCYLS